MLNFKVFSITTLANKSNILIYFSGAQILRTIAIFMIEIFSSVPTFFFIQYTCILYFLPIRQYDNDNKMKPKRKFSS